MTRSYHNRIAPAQAYVADGLATANATVDSVAVSEADVAAIRQRVEDLNLEQLQPGTLAVRAPLPPQPAQPLRRRGCIEGPPWRGRCASCSCRAAPSAGSCEAGSEPFSPAPATSCPLPQMIDGFRGDLASVLSGLRSATADIQSQVGGQSLCGASGHSPCWRPGVRCWAGGRRVAAGKHFATRQPAACSLLLLLLLLLYSQVLDKMQQLQDDWQPTLDKLDVA